MRETLFVIKNVLLKKIRKKSKSNVLINVKIDRYSNKYLLSFEIVEKEFDNEKEIKSYLAHLLEV